MDTTDIEIQDAVVHELKWDTRVEHEHITAAVSRGVVTLSGSVSSWALRLSAQEAAQRVVGVVEVSNSLDVKAQRGGPSDTEIARAVQTALDWDVFIPKACIRSSVSKGHVTLEGHVEHCAEREDAERAVRNIVGVVRVYNKIQLKRVTAAPHQIQHSIEAALERRAAPGANRVNLDVHEGKVILTGVVHSFAERQSVVGAVKGTPGVRSVDDRLRIQP